MIGRPWAATEMPRWRNALIDDVRDMPSDDDTGDRSAHISRLRAAELYFVTRDMTTAALDASQDMPPWTPAIEIPSPIGLIVYVGDLPAIPVDAERARGIYLGRPPALCGFFWAQYGGLLHVDALTSADEIDRVARAHGVPPVTRADDALHPIDELTAVPMTGIITTETTGKAAGMMRLLGATWVMMQQSTMASPRQVAGVGSSRVEYRQLPRSVTILDLRPMRHVPEERDPHHPGRIHTHRWVVRGHWRDQAHGPGRLERKRIWVPSYIKGPEGAPLIARERVSIWRH